MDEAPEAAHRGCIHNGLHHQFVLAFAEHPPPSYSITDLNTLWTGLAPRNAADARTRPKAEYEHEPTIGLRAGLTELVFEQLHLCDRCRAVYTAPTLPADCPSLSIDDAHVAQVHRGYRHQQPEQLMCQRPALGQVGRGLKGKHAGSPGAGLHEVDLLLDRRREGHAV